MKKKTTILWIISSSLFVLFFIHLYYLIMDNSKKSLIINQLQNYLLSIFIINSLLFYSISIINLLLIWGQNLVKKGAYLRPSGGLYANRCSRNLFGKNLSPPRNTAYYQ